MTRLPHCMGYEGHSIFLMSSHAHRALDAFLQLRTLWIYRLLGSKSLFSGRVRHVFSSSQIKQPPYRHAASPIVQFKKTTTPLSARGCLLFAPPPPITNPCCVLALCDVSPNARSFPWWIHRLGFYSFPFWTQRLGFGFFSLVVQCIGFDFFPGGFKGLGLNFSLVVPKSWV